MNLSRFIVNYPALDDEEFDMKMARKTEIRELVQNQTGRFKANPHFHNGQMAPARWMAPWTNSRSILLRWDTGVGKSRGAFAIVHTYMEYSTYKKCLLFATNPAIMKSFDREVLKYYGQDIVLNEKEYKTQGRGNGKLNAASRFLAEKGFTRFTIIKFINTIVKKVGAKRTILPEIYKNLDRNNDMLANGEEPEGNASNPDVVQFRVWKAIVEQIRASYKDHIIFMDEVHLLREGSGDNKQVYAASLIILDALRDICPIILATATPYVNTWQDIVSVVSMMYNREDRKVLQEQADQLQERLSEATNDIDKDEIRKKIGLLIEKWSKGKVSDRTGGGVVPDRKHLKNEYTVNGSGKFTLYDDDGKVGELTENIYPVFMSPFQTEVTMRLESNGTRVEDDEQEDMDHPLEESTKGTTILRQFYDFTPPYIQSENLSGNTVISHISPDLLINEVSDRYIPSAASRLDLDDGEIEEVFKVYYEDDGSIRNDIGLGKYSAKYAELIKMLNTREEFKGKAGFVHSLWVRYGTKMIAASLNSNGWQQYTQVDPPGIPSKPRFALIHDKVSEAERDRILTLYNSKENENGKLIALIVGSKKSGIAMSFLNAQYFIELSPYFNKATRIQSEGRVFRADALIWKANKDRFIYIADMIAFPCLYSGVENESLQEYRDDIKNGRIVNKNYVSIDNFDLSPYNLEVRMEYLSEQKHIDASRATSGLVKGSIENLVEKYKYLEGDDSTRVLIYGALDIDDKTRDIVQGISNKWEYKVDPKNMYEMMAAANLISSGALAMTRYGYARPVRSIGETLTAHSGKNGSVLSSVYDKNFFLTNQNRGYGKEVVDGVIEYIAKGPKDEYGFIQHMCVQGMDFTKIVALEICIAQPDYLTRDQVNILESRRDQILALYDNFWTVFGGSSIVHDLWYGVKPRASSSKIGISKKLEQTCRILPYTKNNLSTNFRWKYVDTSDKESVYLSYLNTKLANKEEDIRKYAIPKYGCYVNLSLEDGRLRFRNPNMDKLKESKSPFIENPTVAPLISAILGKPLPQVKDYIKLSAEVYYKAKELGILIIR